jgi:hypothetical protein
MEFMMRMMDASCTSLETVGRMVGIEERERREKAKVAQQRKDKQLVTESMA